MQLTAGFWLSVASAAVSLAVAGYAHRQDVPGATGVVAFGLAAAVWAGGNAVQVAATSLDAKLLAVDVQYVGIAVLPLAWFAFAAEYTGRGEWVNRRVVAWLAVVPAVTLALVFTNDLHGLVRTSATVESVGDVQRLDRTFGPAFWVAVAYSNLVNAAGTVMLLEGMLRVGSEYRQQTAVVLVGATVPWVANLAYLGGATHLEPEAFLGVTSLAFGYAVARYDLLELVPVARDRVFAELDDGVLVVGGDGRVADYNPAAERLLGVDLAAGDVLLDVAPEAVAEAVGNERREPVAVDRGDETRWLTVRADGIRAGTPGEVVLLRDVTDLERQRVRLDRENERLERVADTISHDLRNPLSVASGYLELAEESDDPEAFAHVRGALDRMDDIIEGTLRLARAGRGSVDRTEVSLAAVAARAWSNVPTGDATLDVDVDDTRVYADPNQIQSLFENVFRNAVEHGSTSPRSQVHEDAAEHGSSSPRSQTHEDAAEHGSSSPRSQTHEDAAEHGSTSPVPPDRRDSVEPGGESNEHSKTSEDNNRSEDDETSENDETSDGVRVSVRATPDGFHVTDDGPGIPDGAREDAFERGYSTGDGTGLGLAIVHDVADAHGWTVALEESDGGGVRVAFSGVRRTGDA